MAKSDLKGGGPLRQRSTENLTEASRVDISVKPAPQRNRDLRRFFTDHDYQGICLLAEANRRPMPCAQRLVGDRILRQR